MYNCEKCGCKVQQKYGSGKFCGVSCANTRTHSIETKEKIKNTLKSKVEIIILICPICNINFPKRKNKNTKTCSRSCGSKFYAQTDQGKLHRQKIGCKSASIQTLRSKNEMYLYELLLKHFNTFKIENNQKIFNGWDADIIITDLKLAILWNGKWHYEKIKQNHSLLQVQNRDKIKLKEIYKCGYSFYVIKDMGRFNKNFVEQEFIKLINFINYYLN
jgi:hypothetical protein